MSDITVPFLKSTTQINLEPWEILNDGHNK